jgi:hypothetical protein
LATSNGYAEVTLRTKQAALEKFTIPANPEKRIPNKPA